MAGEEKDGSMRKNRTAWNLRFGWLGMGAAVNRVIVRDWGVGVKLACTYAFSVALGRG